MAVLLPNIPAMLELHHGVPAAGGVLVAINTRLGVAEVRYILEHSGHAFLLVDAELEASSRSARAVEIVRVDDTGRTDDPYEELLATGDPAGVERLLQDEEEPIAIDYVGNHGAAEGGRLHLPRRLPERPGEAIEVGLGHHPVYLWTLPMFHCNGWCFPWAVTAAGGTHVCLRGWTPRRVAAPARGGRHPLQRLAHRADLPREPPRRGAAGAARDRHRGRRPAVAHAARPARGAEHPRRARLRLTETYGPHTVRSWQDEWEGLAQEERARLAGRDRPPVIADLVRVVDAEMRDVRGTAPAWARSYAGQQRDAGLLRRPRGDGPGLRGGWFHSGDLAVWHRDGAIELRDRGKDIIVSGGENISSIEVEQTIASHPAVLECAVVAVPHDHWGNGRRPS